MKKFPSAIFTSQGQNSCVMHCLSCALFFCTCLSKGAAIGCRPPPVAIAGRWYIQADWQCFPSQGRVGERSDLSFAVPFLLVRPHAFVACFVQVVITLLYKALGSVWFISKVDDLKKVQSSELVVVQSNLMLCLGERWMKKTNKAGSDASQNVFSSTRVQVHGGYCRFAVRQLRQRSRTKWSVTQMKLIFLANRTSRCLCHQLFC